MTSNYQALCLAEICQILRTHHKIKPTLIFLDIKSAYDTVDRNLIWQSLQPTTPPPLLALLQHLFDQVYLEVLLNNETSYRFSPRTGVLQGSILSPMLYSIYINDLPKRLRLKQPSEDTSPVELAPLINCLLYADDVVLISERAQMPKLLKICEDYSFSLGFHWNPSKCVVLSDMNDDLSYELYGQTLLKQHSFSYLGVPFKPGGYLNPQELIEHNVCKAFAMMNVLTSVGVNPNGFDRLLSTRFYAQIVRARLEYGLAINRLTASQIKVLEDAQNDCLRRIYGASKRASTKVMRHLSRLPTMKERLNILQAQFLFRSFTLPEDALLTKLMPHIQNDRHQQWYKLSKSSLWKIMPPPVEELSLKAFKAIKKQFLQQSLDYQKQCKNSKLLSCCRPTVSLDPILWLPMTRKERSRCIRWRLGWLPGGKPRPCPIHPNQTLTKSHAIQCLNMHNRLQMPSAIEDPLSFLLNILPTKLPRSSHTVTPWILRWPTICSILFKLDHLYNHIDTCTRPPHGQLLLNWLLKH
ncbi:hypothetical protein G6F49_009974 [Rhizopus delemar]|nr:hypothetical protein G6F49_009974 [Rhizopus delemar]